MLATGECPRVAELINYALGQASTGECRRVEDHLRQGECEACRRWLDQAGRFRTVPAPEAAPRWRGEPLLAAVVLPRRPAPGEQTPLPESPRWQHQAFSELEERLRLLEEA
jgi:hypothetical protein